VGARLEPLERQPLELRDVDRLGDAARLFGERARGATRWHPSALMAKRRKRREREPVETVDYTDAEGNVLTLRKELSERTIKKIGERPKPDAASAEDAWARRNEMLFERLVVRWEIAGLPLDDQKMLIARYRMADSGEQQWVRETIADHVERHIPSLR
jgi:hypothetical protein